jgi:ribosome-associated toxin RatA of RatAB toxin-antitoxin module
LALEAIALPGLFKRTMQGWNFMFYSQLVSIIGGILSYNIVGTLIGAVIGLYILYQVKNKYK